MSEEKVQETGEVQEVKDNSSEEGDGMSPLQKTLFGLVVIAILGFVGILVSKDADDVPPQVSLGKEKEEVAVAQTEQPTQTPIAEEDDMTKITKLIIEDKLIGSGDEAANGDLVTVNYTGTLLDGTQFDSSLDEGRSPFTFTLGQGSVIEGWDVGVVGMKVGGVRVLTIPADMAYGEQSPSPLIPPNSVLVFEIELLEIEN